MRITEIVGAAERLYTVFLEWIVIGLVAAVTVVVSSQIVARGMFSVSLPWSEELARLCLAWLTFIGAAVVTQRGAHIKVELVSEQLKPLSRALLDLAVHCMMLFFICLLLWTGPTIIRSTSAVRLAALDWPTSLMHLAPFVGAAAMLPYLICNIVKRADGARRALAA